MTVLVDADHAHYCVDNTMARIILEVLQRQCWSVFLCYEAVVLIGIRDNKAFLFGLAGRKLGFSTPGYQQRREEQQRHQNKWQ
jgi:hypothetical protein